MITVTAFRWVPPFAQGLSRDLRVRWALGGAGGFATGCARSGSRTRRRPSTGAAAVRAGAGARGRRADAVRVGGDHAAHRRQVRGADAARRPPARRGRRPGFSLTLNTVEPAVAPLAGLTTCSTPARSGRRRAGRRPRRRCGSAGRPGGAARRAGVARGSLHRRRPDDGDRAPDPAPHRAGCRAAGGRRLPCALHGAAGLRPGARGPSGSVRAGRGVAKQPSRPSGSRQRRGRSSSDGARPRSSYEVRDRDGAAAGVRRGMPRDPGSCECDAQLTACNVPGLLPPLTSAADERPLWSFNRGASSMYAHRDDCRRAPAAGCATTAPAAAA